MVARSAPIAGNADPTADGVGVAEEMARHTLIEDGHFRGSCAIGCGEFAPAEQRGLHGCKVIRACHLHIDRGQVFAFVRNGALNFDAGVAHADAEGFVHG